MISCIMGAPLVLGAIAWMLALPTPSLPGLCRWAATFATTVAVWVLHIPERFDLRPFGLKPGDLDLVGASHQLMHVLVIVVVLPVAAALRAAARVGRGNGV
jgi:hypothetical protein